MHDVLPQLPNYPDLDQMVRVYAASIGGNIYPGYTQQYGGALSFRDREQCYVYEPNGVSLSGAYYDCRLIGSHLGLPLYGTSCCVSGGSLAPTPSSAAPSAAPAGSSSASAASSTPAEAPTIYSAASGQKMDANVTSFTIASVTVQTGLLVVAVNHPISTGGNSNASFNGVAMTLAAGVSTTDARVRVFYLAVSAGTGDIVVTISSPGRVQVIAVGVTGLANNTLDKASTATGTTGAPNSGSATTTVNKEAILGFVGLHNASGAWTWDTPLVSGGQDLTASPPFFDTYDLTGGRYPASATASFGASLSGVTAAHWAAVLATFS